MRSPFYKPEVTDQLNAKTHCVIGFYTDDNTLLGYRNDTFGSLGNRGKVYSYTPSQMKILVDSTTSIFARSRDEKETVNGLIGRAASFHLHDTVFMHAFPVDIRGEITSREPLETHVFMHVLPLND